MVYKNPKVKEKIHLCKKCGVQFHQVAKSKKTICSPECRKHSDETKANISTKRTEYLNNNKDKHPWKRNDKFISVPCENVKQYLVNNNYEFIEEYSPIVDRNFSIDIAFPHLKIGIEINGNQHYDKAGNLNKYYQDRHDLIESTGWKLFEIHYSKCFSDENIRSILDFNYENSCNGIQEYLTTKKPKVETKLPGAKMKEYTDLKYLEIKEDVFNHGIDFSKFGWTVQLGKVIGVKNPGKWMKRHHPEFFENSCFTRKSPTYLY